jgi:diguanylate cyclase (GGDEF)-like protein/PAS domain S-box-containing protein
VEQTSAPAPALPVASAAAAATTGIAVLDDRLQLVGWNRRFAELIGAAADGLDRVAHSDLVHVDDAYRVHRALQQVMATRSFASVPVRYNRPDAPPLSARVVASAADDEGEPRLLLQVLPLAAVPTSDEVFRQVFERAPIPQATIALDGSIMHVNAATCDLLGHSEAELLGAPFPRVVHPDSMRTATDAFVALVGGDERTVRAEVRVVRKDGVVRHTEAYASTVLDETGAPLYFFVLVQDVTEQRQREQQIWHLAVHDALTELPNRAWFLERLGQAVARGRREPSRLAVFFVDLDGFKEVNDTLGHESGDQVLFAAAGRMSRALRPGDTIARYGGDEFTILCEDIPDSADVSEIAERVLAVLREPFLVTGGQPRIAASIGVVVADAGNHSPPALVDAADAAMYTCKTAGGGRYRITEL